MREIIRSAADDNTQYAAINWESVDPFKYTVLHFESVGHGNEPLVFHEQVESLYKKWLLGEEISFTIPVKEYQWNCKENLVPAVMLQQEKNEYLAKKAQKKIQQHFDKVQSEKYTGAISLLEGRIKPDSPREELHEISNEAKAIDEQLKKSVAATKNISLEDGIIEDGINRESFLVLKDQLAKLFDKLKQVKEDGYFTNYNILGAKVEAAYAQSKSSENFNDTRKDIIALQKELFEANLNRWQKDELIARIRKAFDHINERHDAWRSSQAQVKTEQADALFLKYEEVIPQALSLNFSDGFSLLKNLQEITNVSNLSKESRSAFYEKLDEAFKTIKAKADEENEANYQLAEKVVDAAIAGSNASELFKDARSILTSAQNDLREIRLGKKQKDVLFDKLRSAFDELNKKQDAYFTQRKKENNEYLKNLLQTLKRALVRKEEGIERLYQAKQNAEAKTGMFKNTKSSNNDLLNQFMERITDINSKITTAEKDIAQLKKKVIKIEKEVGEHE